MQKRGCITLDIYVVIKITVSKFKLYNIKFNKLASQLWRTVFQRTIDP
jgi:hypothetical protein